MRTAASIAASESGLAAQLLTGVGQKIHYCSVAETQIRFNCRLEITRVQLTGDLTLVGETRPKTKDWSETKSPS